MQTDPPHPPTPALGDAETDDPIFHQEQRHLTATYEMLQALGRSLTCQMDKAARQAADDKRSMAEELAPNFATYADAMETYADFAAMNRVVDSYNLAQDARAEQLAKVQLLLRQPYFAEIVLHIASDQDPKELYIGNAGISDTSYRRLVVDWRSPVAEVYYNQDNGPTSYQADGRTISAEIKLRRQFDIEGSTLNAYFDTSVAIQDPLLLASLTRQRSAQMQAITATIQKEQNLVVRHEDVPVLLVSGIAGSGKTSVLLQRIAYLFYQQRKSLDAREVFLITPNPVFRHYIAGVLPDLGEHNPETLTWDEFAHSLLPGGRNSTGDHPFLEELEHIDAALASFEFEPNDFKDLRAAGTRLISADQIRKLAEKFGHIPAGPHRITLMREELNVRLAGRLKQMAHTDQVQEALSSLGTDEQVRIFHETIDVQDEQEAHAYALRYLQDLYADAFVAAERDDWLRIDRIGMRLLGVQNLTPTTWLYLKMALTGLGNPSAKYVMIDEVQDYTAAQLAVLARYFRRAHFLLLGDPNQAIMPDTASYDEIRSLFADARGSVEECHLMTSYRSTPEITALFARLLTEDERMRISSIQRTETAPVLAEFPDEERYLTALRRVVEQARDNRGLTAVIAPQTHAAKRLQELLGDAAPPLIGPDEVLPEDGVVLIPLRLAKGLEFDQVIIADASERAFPDNPLSRRRLYTAISRATRAITLLAHPHLTPLLIRGGGNAQPWLTS